MATNWISGAVIPIVLDWQIISEQLEINSDKELVSVEIRCENNSNYLCFFDILSIKDDLSNEKASGSEITYIPIPELNISNQMIELPVFGAVKANQIVAAHILTDEDVIGSDTDTIKLSLLNKVTGDLLATKTFATDINATAYTLTDFGPVNTDKQAIEASTGICLKIDPITGVKTFPKSVLVLEWDIN